MRNRAEAELCYDFLPLLEIFLFHIRNIHVSPGTFSAPLPTYAYFLSLCTFLSPLPPPLHEILQPSGPNSRHVPPVFPNPVLGPAPPHVKPPYATECLHGMLGMLAETKADFEGPKSRLPPLGQGTVRYSVTHWPTSTTPTLTPPPSTHTDTLLPSTYPWLSSLPAQPQTCPVRLAPKPNSAQPCPAPCHPLLGIDSSAG